MPGAVPASRGTACVSVRGWRRWRTMPARDAFGNVIPDEQAAGPPPLAVAVPAADEAFAAPPEPPRAPRRRRRGSGPVLGLLVVLAVAGAGVALALRSADTVRDTVRSVRDAVPS